MKLLLAVIALSLAIAGCSSAQGGPGDGSTVTATGTGAAPRTAAADGCDGSLEGCYGYAEMGQYLQAIAPMVRGFFQSAYPGVAGPRDITYIARGQAARGACGVSDSQAYEYCSGSQTIYVGQDLLWAFYRQAGDAAPAIGLAHEWAHHLQFMLGLPGFGAPSQSVNVENQADCIAGAWAKYARDQGWLEEDDDIADAGTLLRLIGSREGSSRDHGTADERTRAFTMSYEGGIKACNAFFPRSPIA